MNRCGRCGISFLPGSARYKVDLSIASWFDGVVIDSGEGREGLDSILSEIEGLEQGDLEESIFLKRTYFLCPRCRSALLELLERDMEESHEEGVN